MINVHTHHLRGPRYSREHFNWSANGDGLLELEPAESIQRDRPLRGAGVPLWMIPATAALTFVLTIIWSHS